MGKSAVAVAGGGGDRSVLAGADGGERLAVAVEESSVGGVADVVDGEAQVDGRGGLAAAGEARPPGRAWLRRRGRLARRRWGTRGTLPKPRRAVSSGAIWSQSAVAACSGGAPMRSRRFAETVMSPE